MNRSLITTGLVATTLFALSLAPSMAQAPKIGTVDINKVFNAMPKTDDAKAALKKAEESAESELKGRMDAYKALIEDAKKLEKEVNNSALSESARAEKRKAFAEKAGEVRKLENEINEFRQTRGKQLQEQVLRDRKEILDQILKVVKEKSAAAGYDLVVDTSAPSATGVPTILFAKEALDFSDSVIEELKKTMGSAPKEQKK